MTSSSETLFNAVTDEKAENYTKDLFDAAKKRIGMLPNIYRYMANSPHLLDAYMYSDVLFRQHAPFSPAEKETIYLSISVENECQYCIAVHSTVAEQNAKVPLSTIEAIRKNIIMEDKLSVLSQFTKLLVKARGHVEQKDINDFLDAGFSKEQLLYLILAIGAKTISNYANRLFNTPLDDAFKDHSESN